MRDETKIVITIGPDERQPGELAELVFAAVFASVSGNVGVEVLSPAGVPHVLPEDLAALTDCRESRTGFHAPPPGLDAGADEAAWQDVADDDQARAMCTPEALARLDAARDAADARTQR